MRHVSWKRIKHKKDYRRFEVGIIFGPCHPRDADELMEKVADYVYDLRENHGACVGMQEFEDKD